MAVVTKAVLSGNPAPAPRVTKLWISGYPLPEPGLLLDWDSETDLMSDDGPVLNHEQAEKILIAWAGASVKEADVVRGWQWITPAKMFVTALAMEGSVEIDYWVESAGLFYLYDWPFDFQVKVLEEKTTDGATAGTTKEGTR